MDAMEQESPSAKTKQKAESKAFPTSAGKKRRGNSTTTTGSKRPKVASPTNSRVQTAKPVEPPTHVLVIDNGGDTIKYGWAKHNSGDDPQHLPNVTARLQQQWTVLVADQLNQIQNRNQLIGVTRSTERGMIVNLGNQVQVWKRLLDLLGVVVPMHDETAKAFGWKTARSAAAAAAAAGNNVRQKNKGKDQKQDSLDAKKATSPETGQERLILSHTCAVLLALPPYCPRTLLDSIMTVWMEDFGFSHVGFCVSAVCAATAAASQHPFATTCLVDLGWSATHVVPVYQDRVLLESSSSLAPSSSSSSSAMISDDHDDSATAAATAIRRMPLGGRHLISMWKYYVSYRQWNLMDQEWILRDALHKTGFVSLDFDKDTKLALQKSAGRRPYDREFVLPDFQTTFEGRVRLPLALQREMEQTKAADEDENDDEDIKEEDMVEEEEDDEDGDDNGGSDDEEEETLQQKKHRLLNEKREEERRRREMDTEQQVLNISVERFAVPEVLFRPGDGGLPLKWAGLPSAIALSIQACPAEMQPALYRSVRLVGGLSCLENLSQRLEQELRTMIPCKYELNITVSESPLDEAWHGACRVVTDSPYRKWSVSREEWESSSRRGAWRRLLATKGLNIV